MKKGKLFRISKPYGYYMDDVNKAISKYNDVVDKLQKVIIKKDEKVKALENELNQVKSELQRMQLEMSMLELPDMNHVQEQIILDQFKDQKTMKKPDRKEEEYEVEIPIVGEDVDDEPIELEDSYGFEIVE